MLGTKEDFELIRQQINIEAVANHLMKKQGKQLNDECEAIDNQYSGRPEQRFVQSLLLGVVAELEREASLFFKCSLTLSVLYYELQTRLC